MVVNMGFMLLARNDEYDVLIALTRLTIDMIDSAGEVSGQNEVFCGL